MKRRSLRIIFLLFACAAANTAEDRAPHVFASADSIGPSSWSVLIEATATGVHDSLALMGVQPDATPDYDLQYDVPRPPAPPGSYIMVYFPHDTGNWPTILGTKFAVDYTSPETPSWRFIVETNARPGPVTLRWDTSGINQLPDSYSIIITDSSADSVFHMRGRETYTFPYSTPRTFRVSVELAFTFIFLSQGWNIVSVPRIVEDFSAATLFPGKISAAYEFDNTYHQRDTMAVGKGYWMKFPAPDLAVMTGFGIDSLDIPVSEGWNLIGSVSRTIPPPNSPIIATPFYEYSGGYHRADSIIPGRGYWIKVDADGILSLGSSFQKRQAGEPSGQSLPAGRRGSIDITDDGGGEATLEVLHSGEGIFADYYSLPPPPPADGFDARFPDGRGAVVLDRVPGPVTEVAVVVQSTRGNLFFHGIPEDPFEHYSLKTGPDQWKAITGTSEPVAITRGPGRNIFTLRITTAPTGPGPFALDRNFPNPFNPLDDHPIHTARGRLDGSHCAGCRRGDRPTVENLGDREE